MTDHLIRIDGKWYIDLDLYDEKQKEIIIENKQLKDRINKAKEYIKSQQVIFQDCDIVVDNQLKNILEILGDKEWKL